MPGRRKRDLVQKMLVAQSELQNYLILHKAKGYMSDNDSEILRGKLFGLCSALREQFPLFRAILTPEEVTAFQDGTGALTTAALCLMGGKHDCPRFVAVDTAKLELNLKIVQQATGYLTRNNMVQDA